MGWRWLFEPLTMGSRFPLPYQVSWFIESYSKLVPILLLAGLAATLFKPNRQLWWFLAPALLSALVCGVGLALGPKLPDLGALLVLASLAAGLILTVVAVVKSRRTWLAGLVFTVNSIVILGYQGLVSMFVLTGAAI